MHEFRRASGKSPFCSPDRRIRVAPASDFIRIRTSARAAMRANRSV